MNPTISKLNLVKFRGVQNLALDDLSSINVLIGANNSGKTSVLEAIRLMSNPGDMGTLFQIALLRSPPSTRRAKLVEYFSTLFVKEIDTDFPEKIHYGLEIHATINSKPYEYLAGGDIGESTDTTGIVNKSFSLTVRTSQGEKKPMYLKHQVVNGRLETFETMHESLFSGMYLHSGVSYYRSCVHYLSESMINEQKGDILDILSTFDPHIEDISIIGQDVYLHNKLSGTLPLFAYGSGLQKAVLLTALLADNRNGVLLIDEIDNAINISAFHEVFSWFVFACKKLNIQAFVTTHSAEAIDAIIETINSSEDDCVRIITLRKDPEFNKTRAIIRTGREAFEERSEFEMELRV